MQFTNILDYKDAKIFPCIILGKRDYIIRLFYFQIHDLFLNDTPIFIIYDPI